jgi:hypothetical protein
MNFAICFLAYGDEHIDEFNLICKELLNINSNLNIFVCTNDVSKIKNKKINIIETKEKFNYNLKKEAIKCALKKFNTIVCMDTDMVLRKNINFEAIDNLDDGLYITTSPFKNFKYKKKLISINKILNDTEYGNSLKVYANTNDLYSIDEQIFILKINDLNKKNAFINHWDYIFNNFQSNDFNQYGMYEGLNIFTAAKLSDIVIGVSTLNLNIFFDSFSHCGWEVKKINKKMLI